MITLTITDTIIPMTTITIIDGVGFIVDFACRGPRAITGLLFVTTLSVICFLAGRRTRHWRKHRLPVQKTKDAPLNALAVLSRVEQRLHELAHDVDDKIPTQLSRIDEIIAASDREILRLQDNLRWNPQSAGSSRPNARQPDFELIDEPYATTNDPVVLPGRHVGPLRRRRAA